MFSKFRQPNDLTYRLGKIRSQSESRHLKKKKENNKNKTFEAADTTRVRDSNEIHFEPPVMATSPKHLS